MLRHEDDATDVQNPSPYANRGAPVDAHQGEQFKMDVKGVIILYVLRSICT